jgi:serine/threonine-protein kinase
MTEPLHARVISAVAHQYAIENEIGRGGMSVVYRAHDLRLNRPVAIKVLPPELAYDPAIRTRFTREAQTSAQLAHSHIVPIYDVGEREGIAYLVMAIVTGGNLGALLAHEPQQPMDEVRRLLCEIADALAYAHLRGVIHRDIKPDNILLDAETGRALVTDFGIARAIEAGSGLTQTGIAVGTPTYMSPEQAMGERGIDGRSDIYSLGVLGYQMLTGRVPFTAGNSMALLMKHVNERPRPIAELRPDVPTVLREVVERAMMKAPEERWPTAASMRDALSADAMPAAAWRIERPRPVRYSTPKPEGARRERSRSEVPRPDGRTDSPRRGAAALDARGGASAPARPAGEVVLVPEHLAALTPEQLRDLRLWNGRVHLYDRVKAARAYGWATVLTTIVGFGMIAATADVPPAILAPVVPIWMLRKMAHRRRSLHESGLRLRRVLFSLRAKWVIRGPAPAPSEKQLEKLAPREILDGGQGGAIRRAAADRAAILDIVAQLPKEDRAMLPDVVPTVNALLGRVAELAKALYRLEQSMDPRQLEELDRRIADAERHGDTSEGQRRLALFRRQRESVEQLDARRTELAHQIESAGLALGNLRLDLIKLRSSGLRSALSDVTSATQQARALSRELGAVLEAVAESRGL